MDRGKQQSHQQHFRTEHFGLPVIPAQAGIQDVVMQPVSGITANVVLLLPKARAGHVEGSEPQGAVAA